MVTLFEESKLLSISISGSKNQYRPPLLNTCTSWCMVRMVPPLPQFEPGKTLLSHLKCCGPVSHPGYTVPALHNESRHATDHVHGEVDGADLSLVGQVGGGQTAAVGLLQRQADLLQGVQHLSALDVDKEPAGAVQLHHRHLVLKHARARARAHAHAHTHTHTHTQQIYTLLCIFYV